MSEKMPNDHTDLIWTTHMQTLTRRMRNMEVSQIINDAILEWYSDQGQEVPQWRMQKDPQWWIDYLNELKGETDGQ